jgi:hypothetical protein
MVQASCVCILNVCILEVSVESVIGLTFFALMPKMEKNSVPIPSPHAPIWTIWPTVNRFSISLDGFARINV